MEIVIKLPEATYKAVKDVCMIAGWPVDWEAIFRDVFWEALFRDVFWAINGGQTLPKGHGRLIDVDRYRKDFLEGRTFEPMKTLDLQPTIIEADGGDGNVKG